MLKVIGGTILNATQNLKNDHVIIKRIRNISQTCSDKLYVNQFIPITDIEILSVIMEEFVDNFHHGKEEKAYFPETKDKDGFAEDIRKFLIEHELGRRIAMMLRRELEKWKKSMEKEDNRELKEAYGSVNEPVARFLKAYADLLDDPMGNEDDFVEMVEEKDSITNEEDAVLLKYYESCKIQEAGGIRMQEMVRLMAYLEAGARMKV